MTAIKFFEVGTYMHSFTMFPYMKLQTLEELSSLLQSDIHFFPLRLCQGIASCLQKKHPCNQQNSELSLKMVSAICFFRKASLDVCKFTF